MFIYFSTQHDLSCLSFKSQPDYTDPTQSVREITAAFWLVEKNFPCHSVFESRLPDVGPAGSVGQNQNRGLIFGQTDHYFQDHIFNAGQYFCTGNKGAVRVTIYQNDE